MGVSSVYSYAIPLRDESNFSSPTSLKEGGEGTGAGGGLGILAALWQHLFRR